MRKTGPMNKRRTLENTYLQAEDTGFLPSVSRQYLLNLFDPQLFSSGIHILQGWLLKDSECESALVNHQTRKS